MSRARKLNRRGMPMSAANRPGSIADLPTQCAAAPENDAQARARYFNSGNAFDVKLPAVPDAVFVHEPARALHRSAPTGLVACDASAEMQCGSQATTPLILARYARIRAGDEITTRFNASGVLHYVIQGSGTTRTGDEAIAWRAGDVFVTPGGWEQQHAADACDVVLWLVTNEPHLAFEHLQPPAADHAPTGVVHYRADDIARQIDLIHDIGGGDDVAGAALVFSSDVQEASRNVLPSLTLAMNTLPPGTMQRPHRHNSVAVSLVIQGVRCYSMINGERKDWAPWATTITPPASVHSHHNEGDAHALFLIVQDGGLYYHTRAMGFEFADG